MASETGELRLRIVVDDAKTIPAATQAAAAAVDSDTRKISNSFQQAGQHASNAGKDMEYSMTEARHAIQGAGEEIGIHLPRFVTTFLAENSKIGPAMAAAFSTIAVVGLIQVLGQIPVLLGEMVNALRGWDEEAKKAFKEEVTAAAEVSREMREIAEAQINATAAGKEHQAKYNQELTNANEIAKEATLRNADLTQQINALRIRIDELKHAWGSGGLLTGIFNAKEIDKAETQLASLQAQQKQAESEAVAGRIKNITLTTDKQVDAAKLAIDLQKSTIDGELKLEQAKLAGVEADLKARVGVTRLSIDAEAAAYADLENRKYTAAKTAMDKKAALAKTDPSATPASMETLQSEAAALEQSHQVRLNEIAANAQKERIDLTKQELDNARAMDTARFAITEQGLTKRIDGLKLGVKEETREATDLENRKYEAERNGIAKRIELARLDPSANPGTLAGLNNQLEILEQQHQLKLNAIKSEGMTALDAERKKRLANEKQIAIELNNITEQAAVDQLSNAQKMADLRLESGKIGLTAWKNQEKQALEDSFRAQIASVDEKIKLYGDDTAALARELAKRKKLEDQYYKDLAEIERHSFVTSKQVLDLVDRNFGSHMTAWIAGQEKFKTAMETAWNGIATSFITNSLRMVEQALIAAAIHKSIAAKEILVEAKRTAAHAFRATMAALPFPADVILAPVVAAGAFAGVMALASFDRGGVMENDGMAMIHKKEMVLDPSLSTGLQQLIMGGGVSKGKSGGGDINLHYHAHGAGTTSQHKQNMNELAKTIKKLQRNGALPSQ